MKIPWTKWEAIGVTEIRESQSGRTSDDFQFELTFVGGSDEDIALLIYKEMPMWDRIWLKGNTRVEVDIGYGISVVWFSREGG